MSTRGGGCNCAIATCDLYSGKTKKNGMTDISFHRFPKDLEAQKIWTQKCKREDAWNSSKSYICSKHFTSEDFVRDLKSELMGSKPVRRLKPGSVPTLNLPTCFSTVSQSALERRSRMEAKSKKESHDQLIATTLNTEPTISTVMFDEAFTENNQILDPNYKIMFDKLYKKHQHLKSENEKLKIELLSYKNSDLDYKRINENLRYGMKILQTRLKTLNLALTRSQKSSSKLIKTLTQNKTIAIETKAKSYLSTIFTPNQLDLLMKKKKQVHWTREEISKAFTLRYFSKRAYVFVKSELHYPLPGLSSLQRWAKGICMRNGIIHDVMNSSNTNDNNQEEFMVAKTFKQINFQITDNENNGDIKIGTDTDNDTSIENEPENLNEMTQDAVEYLAGWIAKKYRMKFPEIGCTTTQLNASRVNDHNYQLPTWIKHLSYGGLIVPSNYFKTKIFRIEKLFRKFTKRKIPKGPSVVKQLTQKIINRIEIEEKYYPVIQAYVKQRIFIRMKYITKNHQALIAKRKARTQLLRLQKLQRIMT